MLAYRQTDTQRDKLIAILHSPIGVELAKSSAVYSFHYRSTRIHC